MDNNLMFTDIETGGFDKIRDAVCSITIKYNGDMRTWYLKPYGKRYKKSALKVNGLSLRKLYDIGIEPKQVVKEISAFLLYNKNDDNMFAGHNMHFDLSFLEILHREYNSNIYENINYHYVDTMQMAISLRNRGKINPKSLKLVDLYTCFYDDGLEKGAHASDTDVLMLEKVHKRLVELENE